MATNFGAKSSNDLYLSHWHSETDWNIEKWISSFIATMIDLHRVNIWWTSASSPEIRSDKL